MLTRFIEILNRPVAKSLILVLGLVITFCAMTPELGKPAKDYDGYFVYSGTLIENGTFGNPPDNWITPGYPMVLAFFRLFLPEQFLLLANLFLFAAASVLFLKFLSWLGIDLRIWSSALVLFLWFSNPFFIFLQGKLLSENAFIPTFMAFSWFMMRYLDEGSRRSAFWAFVWLALSAYVRPVSIYLAPVCAVLMVVRRRNLTDALVGLAAFIITLSPWMFRNDAVMGRFEFTPSHVISESLLGSNNTFLLLERPDLKGTWMGIGDIAKMTSDPVLKEKLKVWLGFHDKHRFVEMETYSKLLVLDFWKNHVTELPGFALSKLKWFWHYSARHPLNRTWYFDALGVIWYLAWLPLAAVTFLGRRHSGLTWLFAVCAIYFSAVTVVTFGSARMRMPIEFFLLAMAICAVPVLFPRLKV